MRFKTNSLRYYYVLEALAAEESFSFIWAAALLWHLTWHGQWSHSYWHGTLFFSACGQLIWPLSTSLMFVTHSLSAVLFFSPSGANHEILIAFVGITICASRILNVLGHQVRRFNSTSSILNVFPVIRSYLLTLYAAAFFHKLNKDYFNPDVSCAVTVTEKTLAKFFSQRYTLGKTWRQVLVYNSLILELFLPLALVAPRPVPLHWRGRLRMIAIMLGIVFHVRILHPKTIVIIHA